MNGFIIAWIAFQVSLPLVRALDTSNGNYFYGAFSWSMFGRSKMICEVSLFVVEADGARRELTATDGVPHRFGWRSPEPSRVGFPKEGRFEARVRAFIDHLAAARADGREYGAEIQWLQRRDPDWPRQWRHTARAVAP